MIRSFMIVRPKIIMMKINTAKSTQNKLGKKSL